MRAISKIALCAAGWALLGTVAAQAQAPAGDGSDRDLWHPLYTWKRPVSRFEPGAIPQLPMVGISRKLSSIIVPHVEFRATSLADAVEYLRQEASRLDIDSPPGDRGVNIVIAPSQVPNANVAQTRVTLTLSRIPLIEAIRYVAEQAGLHMKMETHAVSLLSPEDALQQQVTAIFTVKLDFFNLQPQH